MMGNVISGAAKVGIPEDNTSVISTSIDIVVDGKVIGAIESFNVSMSRAVQRIRELNSSMAGQVKELAPSPEDCTIQASGFLIYTNNQQHLFQRIAGDDGKTYVSLGSNIKYFDITEKYTHPATNKTFKVEYKRCLLSNYSKSQQITNAVIAETVSIEASYVLSEIVP